MERIEVGRYQMDGLIPSPKKAKSSPHGRCSSVPKGMYRLASGMKKANSPFLIAVARITRGHFRGSRMKLCHSSANAGAGGPSLLHRKENSHGSSGRQAFGLYFNSAL
jgi:hypothetical protein